MGKKKIPPCAAEMGCLCAAHARGAPAIAKCNADETAPVPGSPRVGHCDACGRDDVKLAPVKVPKCHRCYRRGLKTPGESMPPLREGIGEFADVSFRVPRQLWETVKKRVPEGERSDFIRRALVMKLGVAEQTRLLAELKSEVINNEQRPRMPGMLRYLPLIAALED